MTRLVICVFVLLLTALPLRAATMDVGYTGTVYRITGAAEFLAAVPVAIGDTLSVSATMLTNPILSPSVETDFYLDPFVSLTGIVGGYTFSLTTTPDPFRPIPNQNAAITNDIRGLDRVSTRAHVAGGDIAGYQATNFQYDASDASAGILGDRSYDPLYFDQSFLTRLALVPLDSFGRPQGDAQARLLFKTSDPRGPTASIWIDLKVDPATLAAVPLPASGLVLLIGVGILSLFGARTRRSAG